MKKLIYLFLVLGLFACSSDSDDDESPNFFLDYHNNSFFLLDASFICSTCEDDIIVGFSNTNNPVLLEGVGFDVNDSVDDNGCFYFPFNWMISNTENELQMEYFRYGNFDYEYDEIHFLSLDGGDVLIKFYDNNVLDQEFLMTPTSSLTCTF